MKRHALLAGITLLLAACAARMPTPLETPKLTLPLSLHIQRQAGGDRQDWLLVLQAENQSVRGSLFDPLGTPLARQRLVQGTWQADGLLPPNAEARELLAAVLFALTPEVELSHAYPQAQRQGGKRRLAGWQAEYRNALDFTLQRQNSPRYQVTALPLQEGS